MGKKSHETKVRVCLVRGCELKTTSKGMKAHALQCAVVARIEEKLTYLEWRHDGV